jgi:hypothetical protein
MDVPTLENPVVAAQETAVGKMAGRPARSTRDDVAVKIDRGLKAKAQYVADSRGVPLAEYLSEAPRPIVGKDFDRAARSDGAEGGK